MTALTVLSAVTVLFALALRPSHPKEPPLLLGTTANANSPSCAR